MDAEDDAEDASIMDDVGDLSKLLLVLDRRKDASDIALPFNADVIIITPGPLRLLAHKLILAMRCPVLGDILQNSYSLNDKPSGIEISLVSGGNTKTVQISG